LCPCPKEEKRGRRKNNDELVPSVILYRNRFRSPNLGAAVGVQKKIEPPKVEEHLN